MIKTRKNKERPVLIATFVFVFWIGLMLVISGCNTGKEPETTLTLNNKGDFQNKEEGDTMKILGLDIALLNHASVRIKDRKIIYIDPFELTEGSELDKADLVLITHSHYDHCSLKDVEKISTENTVIITVADCQSKLSNLKVKGITVIEPGKTIKINGENISISAVPAYNPDKEFHPKENGWVGFIVEMDGVKVYHAGDTGLIPEMKNIETDIALLPVGGTYTMNAEEAAQATKDLKRCKIAIPMHYGSIIGSGSDAEKFKELAGCEVKILM